MQKKFLVLFIGITLIVSAGIIFWKNSNQINNNNLDNLESIFHQTDNHIEKSFIEIFPLALDKKKLSFFAENIPPSNHRENFVQSIQSFEHILDINISSTEKFIFFSFYGVEKNSNRLVSQYGYIDQQSKEIFYNPKLSLIKSREENNNNIFYTNSTKFPLFFSSEILSLPGDKKLENFPEKIIPGEKISLEISKKIELIELIEDISTGIQISIK